MMKRSIYFLLFFLIIGFYANAHQKPKYIFFMIGDGMGLNQVNVAEVFQASIENKNTVFPLVFTQFPHGTFATSYSLSNGVTDSAAGGTALAVGFKTKNGILAMDSTGKQSYKSLAYLAKENNMKVGIVTSVSIDHATPASFYARQPNRNMYYEIGLDLITSNFDFFGGAGFLSPEHNSKKQQVQHLFPQFEKGGYVLAHGIEEYNAISDKSQKIILMNDQGESNSELSYAIDRNEQDLTLKQITEAAITSLSKNNEEGFFLMVEGGKIDWACHANDGATAIKETLDFASAVQEAYDFYQKHPDETLIIVTADHETGGLALGNGSYQLQLNNIAHQKMSQSALSALITKFRKENPNASWSQVKELLSKNLGLWTHVNISAADEEEIKKAYERSFLDHKDETEKSLYAIDDKIAALATHTLNKASSLSWASGGHSAAYIPVYAIGSGSELFIHKMDNTDIPRKVSQALGWSMHLLSPQDFSALSGQLVDAKIIDVRTKEEFEEGHISDAVNIELKQIDSFVDEISSIPKNQPIFVYCLGGVRSAKAVEILRKEGFEKVYELHEGYDAWKDRELPIIR